MLRRFSRVITTLQRSGGGRFAASFEWPRNDGWNESLNPGMKHIRRLLPFSVDFEGCAFGLRGRDGRLLMKPWRIQTSHPAVIQSFQSRRCNRSHPHGQTRGKDAQASENYTDSMVALLSRSLSKPLPRSRMLRDVMVGSKSSSSSTSTSVPTKVRSKARKHDTHLVVSPAKSAAARIA